MIFSNLLLFAGIIITICLFSFVVVVASSSVTLEDDNNNNNTQDEKYAFFLICGGPPWDILDGAKPVIEKANQNVGSERFFVFHICQRDPNEMVRWMSDLIATGTYVDQDVRGPMKVGGFGISADTPALIPVINQAFDRGIPVVTFATDAPESKRVAYIGTNNTFFGEQLAKALLQVKPEGGTYAVVGSIEKSTYERHAAFQAVMKARGGKWQEIDASPFVGDFRFENFPNRPAEFHRLQSNISEANPTAIITLQGFIVDEFWWVHWLRYNHWRNITYICADNAPVQMSLLYRNLVHSIVGQMSDEMASQAVLTLMDLLETNTTHIPRPNIGTNVISHTRIPFVLPPLHVDTNLIGDWKYIGYTCFAMVALCCGLATGWTYHMRSLYVVRASQPIFLGMIAGGILIMSSSLIPMSMENHDHDDNNSAFDDLVYYQPTAFCMSVPWLAFVGFSICFSALLSKTWRINLLVQEAAAVHTPGYQRVQITERDVMTPFIMLLTANIVILTVWTVRDPLTYVRQAHAGRDEWERVISTYGMCHSHHVELYLIPLTIVNVSMLAVANVQAYRARHLESEFAESRSIAFVMASMLQALLMGIPVILIVRENPPAFYLILVSIIFAISMTTLLLIFVPKIVFAELFRSQSPEEQALFIHHSLQMSTTTPKSGHLRARAGSSDDGLSLSSTSSYFRPAPPPPSTRSSVRRSSADDEDMILSHHQEGVLVMDRSHVATIQEDYSSRRECDDDDLLVLSKSKSRGKVDDDGKESEWNIYLKEEEEEVARMENDKRDCNEEISILEKEPNSREEKEKETAVFENELKRHCDEPKQEAGFMQESGCEDAKS